MERVLLFFLSSMIEPIGSKSPIFSNDLSSTAYARRNGTSVVLACNAQGSPVPTTR